MKVIRYKTETEHRLAVVDPASTWRNLRDEELIPACKALLMEMTPEQQTEATGHRRGQRWAHLDDDQISGILQQRDEATRTSDRLRAQVEERDKVLVAISRELERKTFVPEELPGVIEQWRKDFDREIDARKATQNSFAKLTMALDEAIGGDEHDKSGGVAERVAHVLTETRRERFEQRARALHLEKRVEELTRERDGRREIIECSHIPEKEEQTIELQRLRRRVVELEAAEESDLAGRVRRQRKELQRLQRRATNDADAIASLQRDVRAAREQRNKACATVEAWRPVVEAATKSRAYRSCDLSDYTVGDGGWLFYQGKHAICPMADLDLWRAVDAMPSDPPRVATSDVRVVVGDPPSVVEVGSPGRRMVPRKP